MLHEICLCHDRLPKRVNGRAMRPGYQDGMAHPRKHTAAANPPQRANMLTDAHEPVVDPQDETALT